MRTLVLAMGALALLTMVGLVVALAWPMPEADGGPKMEVFTCGAEPELGPDADYLARDGRRLPLRISSAEASETALILLHGGSSCGDYLHAMASYLARESSTTVFVPDLRGHGYAPGPRGDVAYVEQLVDDVADLVKHVHQQRSWDRLILGGHSGGGGLALKVAQSEYANSIDGYLLVAPFLGVGSPTDPSPSRANFAFPNVPRIGALTVLNGLGITALDGLPVVRFNWPRHQVTDRLTTSYTWRLLKGLVPGNHASALEAVGEPMLVAVGEEDEAVVAAHVPRVVNRHAPHAECRGVVALSEVPSPMAPSPHAHAFPF